MVRRASSTAEEIAVSLLAQGSCAPGAKFHLDSRSATIVNRDSVPDGSVRVDVPVNHDVRALESIVHVALAGRVVLHHVAAPFDLRDQVNHGRSLPGQSARRIGRSRPPWTGAGPTPRAATVVLRESTEREGR
jgi:hypothetical protein